MRGTDAVEPIPPPILASVKPPGNAMLAPLLALGLAAAAPTASDIERVVQANLPEYLELLAIPNVAGEPADIQRNAAFLQAALEKRGFRVQPLDNPAKRPLV